MPATGDPSRRPIPSAAPVHPHEGPDQTHGALPSSTSRSMGTSCAGLWSLIAQLYPVQIPMQMAQSRCLRPRQSPSPLPSQRQRLPPARESPPRPIRRWRTGQPCSQRALRMPRMSRKTWPRAPCRKRREEGGDGSVPETELLGDNDTLQMGEAEVQLEA